MHNSVDMETRNGLGTQHFRGNAQPVMNGIIGIG